MDAEGIARFLENHPREERASLREWGRSGCIMLLSRFRAYADRFSPHLILWSAPMLRGRHEILLGEFTSLGRWLADELIKCGPQPPMVPHHEQFGPRAQMMRARLAAGDSYADVAKRFGVSRQRVYQVAPAANPPEKPEQAE